MDTNDPCGTRYQTDVFLRNTAWNCLRRDATSTFFLDGVIGSSSNVSTSPYLLIYFKKG